MARKKAQIELIEGLPSIDKLTVEKSRPLTALWQSNMTLAQFKIIDVYLSRINPHKPEKKLVRFEKGEIEKLLGVDRIRKEVLDKRLDGLWRGIRVDHPDLNGFRKVGLFEVADCTKGEDGLWVIELECTQKAMKYIFNIEAIGYIRYKLRSIINLRSRYAYILFIYIEQNRFRKSWTISVDDLRKMIGATEKTYQQFFRFREKVLDRARNELLEKTEQRFTYSPVKAGKTVTAIRFEVETLTNLETVDPDHNPSQYTQEDIQTGCDVPDDATAYIASACCPPGAATTEWTRAEADEIAATLATLPAEYLPGAPEDSVVSRQYLLVKQVYAKMQRVAQKRDIKYRFLYFTKLLKRAIQETIDDHKKRAQATKTIAHISPSAQNAHNFHERETDYDAAIQQRIRQRHEEYTATPDTPKGQESQDSEIYPWLESNN